MREQYLRAVSAALMNVNLSGGSAEALLSGILRSGSGARSETDIAKSVGEQIFSKNGSVGEFNSEVRDVLFSFFDAYGLIAYADKFRIEV